MFGDGAEHESGEQQWQIDDADLQQVACDHAAFFWRDVAKNACEPDCVCKVDDAEDQCDDCVDDARHAETPWREADGDHKDCVEKGLDDGGPSIWLDDGEHPDPGACVFVAVHPGDGHEVGELPDEEDGEKGNGGPLDAPASGGPAEHGTHGAGKGADEGGHGGDALEGCVDSDVSEGRKQSERDGEEIGVEQEPPGTQTDCAEAEKNTNGKRDTAAGKRAISRALHQGVGGAFEGLIEGAGAGGDEADAEEGVEQAALERGDAGLHGAEVKARPAGDEDQPRDANFEELAEVMEQQSRDAGGWSMEGGMCVVLGVRGEIGLGRGLGGGSHGKEGAAGAKWRDAGSPDLMIPRRKAAGGGEVGGIKGRRRRGWRL